MGAQELCATRSLPTGQVYINDLHIHRIAAASTAPYTPKQPRGAGLGERDYTVSTWHSNFDIDSYVVSFYKV